MSSPAQRYAEARRRQAESRSELARFAAGYDFPFDDFQVRACRALEDGTMEIGRASCRERV